MANCKIPLAPNGGNSKLYMDLQNECKGDHLLANYVYATYTALNIGEKMDAAHYARTSSGEHSVKDVAKFLLLKDIITDKDENLIRASKAAGAIDSVTGSPIEYNSALEALLKALSFNLSRKGKVAYVILRGDKFNIVVTNKDSQTQYKSVEVDMLLKAWEILQTLLESKGVSLELLSLYSTSANAVTLDIYFDYLLRLGSIRNDILTLNDIKTILTLSELSPIVKQAITRWGSLEDAALRIYENFHGTPATVGILHFIDKVLTLAKEFSTLRTFIPHVRNLIHSEVATLSLATDLFNILLELERLHDLFGINETIRIRKPELTISALSDAASEASIILKRQIAFLEKLQGRTTLGKEIEATLKTLLNELEGKRYYSGLLLVMSDALKYAEQITLDLKSIPNNGTRIEYMSKVASVLSRSRTLLDSYTELVKALSNLNINFIIDLSITLADCDSLQQAAREVREALEINANIMKHLLESFMIEMCTDVLGTDTINGESIYNIVSMASADSSILDYLYSASRVSDPMLNAMDSVIRDAQSQRTRIMSSYTLDIRRANAKLRASGYKGDTSFMYSKFSFCKDDTYNRYYIISEEGIDWNKYEYERNKAYGRFTKGKKLKGIALKEAMEKWEEEHTLLKLVDSKNGRYERIPNSGYWDPIIREKTWNTLSLALMEYYKEMMRIKAELGTKLPAYALCLYRPVLMRKSFLDLISSAYKKLISGKALSKLLLDRMKFWKIREDDEFFSKNGLVVEGKDTLITDSDANNHILRLIPIFYINFLKNLDELLLQDFGASMQRLAGTAINYECMSKVKDIVETMADWILNRGTAAVLRDTPLFDTVQSGTVKIYKLILEFANKSSRTKMLCLGYIDKYIYGEHTKDKNEKWVLFVRVLLMYNSLRGLALNIKGGMANYLVGEYQMLAKAISGGLTGGIDYNLSDYMKAHALLLGDFTVDAPGKIMDIFTNNKNSKDKLLIDYFDPMVDNFGDQTSLRYHTDPFRIMFGGFNAFGLYASGEYLIHMVNMYAMLLHLKVYKDGKQISLYNALKVGNKIDGNSELVLDGTITLDKEGTVLVDESFLLKYKEKIRGINLNCHGSMAEEDKGAIHDRMVGKLVMNFRLWMVGHYSRRYRGRHFDKAFGLEVEGNRYSVLRLLALLSNSWFKTSYECAARWKDMDARLLQNVREVFSLIALGSMLIALDLLIGSPKSILDSDDSEEEKWFKLFFLYELKMLRRDIEASTLLGLIKTSGSMLNSPIPAVNTIRGMLYIFYGWGDIGEKLQSGPNKGEGKWWRNMKKYTLPWWYQILQLKNLTEDESLFHIFSTEYKMR